MLHMKNLFSEGYSEYLKKRNQIKMLVLDAQEKLKGYTLYGEKIDVNNPEDLIATLYLLYKDYQLYHERR